MVSLGQCLGRGITRCFCKRSNHSQFACNNTHSISSSSLSSSFSTSTSNSNKESLYAWGNDHVSLYSWGNDHHGSLLLSSSKLSSNSIIRKHEKMVDEPAKVEDWKEKILKANKDEEDNMKIQSISCGVTDTAIILTNGNCYVCGKNASGQLGLGHKDPVPELTFLSGNVQQIELGQNFSAYVTTGGDLYTFGFGGSAFGGMGCLGHGNGESYLEPKCVVSLIEDGCYAKQVQVGDSHLTVLTTEGEVLTCGSGSYGRLGNSDSGDQLYLEPVELLSNGVEKISGGKSYTLALSEDGTLYGWGRNDKFQIGTGYGLAVDMYAMEAIPAMIETDELAGRKVIDIDAGAYHAAAITEGGELFIWGMALHFEPVRVNELLHTPVKQVQCGLDYTLALTKDGKLYSFGKKKSCLLGRGSDLVSPNQPQLIETVESHVNQVVAGNDCAFCLTE